MFSNDKNIETIGQLVEVIKHYIGLQSEYVKLDVVEKVVRVLTTLIMAGVLAFLLILMLIYVSFAVAYALAPLTGQVGAFAIVAAFYFVVLMLFIIFRKPWIEKPLVHFLASLLLGK